jgi:hypothetical protein
VEVRVAPAIEDRRRIEQFTYTLKYPNPQENAIEKENTCLPLFVYIAFAGEDLTSDRSIDNFRVLL